MKRSGFLKRTSVLRRSGRLQPMSKKRQRLAKSYSLLRAAFLEAHPQCQAWRHIVSAHPESHLPAFCPPSEDIHHKAGRIGSNYLDTDTWLAVSRRAHRWIHAEPSKARALGLLV